MLVPKIFYTASLMVITESNTIQEQSFPNIYVQLYKKCKLYAFISAN